MARSEDKEKVPLSKAAEYLLEECRMVLPGIQALFGFQLIAVFNDGFHDRLTSVEQDLHLLAIGLIAVAVAIIMTPAAYHRQHNPQEVTETFITVSTRLLLWSMLPLAVAISLDFYIIARIIVHQALSAVLGAALFGVFVLLWFVFPRSRRLQRLVHGRR
jgi:hypothetical protein